MPRFLRLPLLLLVAGCGPGDDDDGPAGLDWGPVKALSAPVLDQADEFEAPARLSIASSAWEDGLYVSRDGLHLYAWYAPVDLLQWQANSGNPGVFRDYLRGPDLGMELSTILHGDIAISSRATTADPFPAWSLSNLSGPPWTEGGVQTTGSGGLIDLFVYGSNEGAPPYSDQVYLIKGTTPDPAAPGTPLPAPVNTATYNESNPHLERLSATDLVLFYETNDVGATGKDHLIRYSLSADDGASWSTPVDVAAVNTHPEQIQPHLYFDGAAWWLYFAATDPVEGKLAIFRMSQGTPGDWGSWVGEERVVGAGNLAAVGEPTLTANGDLMFVAIAEHPDGTSTDRFDCDPWFAPAKP